MLKRIALILFLLSQSACFVLLPFIEQDSFREDKHASSGALKQRRIAKVNPVKQALKKLKNPNDAKRTTAATELGFLGDAKPEVLEALRNSAGNDRSKWVRRAAVKSLYKLAGKQAIPTLKTALKDKDPYVVYSARRALALLK